jgi:hypothetical protein
MSQSQPVIPVTMQYGGGYGGGYGGNHHELHHIEREVHRSGDQIKRDVNESKDYLGTQATQNTNWVRGDISDSKDKITDDVKDGTANVIALLNAQANADQAQTRSSQIETRQAVERNADKCSSDANRNADKASLDANRNADYINNNVKDAEIAGILATQQSAVATALAVQNTSSAIVDHIDGGRRDITSLLGAGFAALGVQNEKNAAFANQMVLTQAQSVLLGQKEAEVNASNNRAMLALQSADYKAASSLQASEYHKDSQLLAQQNFQATQLQAANYSSLSLLKTTESTAAILAKLAECCCENRLAHASSQAIIMQNGNNNQAAIQQGQMNQLTQALAASQNEALMQRITNSVISTTTNVGSNPRTG